MKKMRCSSCGAELKIEDNNEYAVCEHCGSKYKLNEDININFKIDDSMKDVMKQGFENTRKVSKFVIIFIGIIMFGMIIFIFFMGKNNSSRQEEKRQQMDEKQQQVEDAMIKSAFNFQFSLAAGTNVGSHVKKTLDDIIQSNKLYDRKVNLIYNGESTTSEEKIIEIKHSLGDWDKYEVIVNYDDNGFVNEIKIEKIA